MKSCFTFLTSTLIAVALMLSGNTLAVESGGIKTKNLEGADLDLMNDHDPQTELENFELLDGYQINLFASVELYL